MDVNFIASVAAVADDLIPIAIPGPPSPSRNPAPAAPLYLVPPTPPPINAAMQNALREQRHFITRHFDAQSSAANTDNRNHNSNSAGGSGNGNAASMFPPTAIVNDTPPPTRRSIHNLYDAPISIPSNDNNISNVIASDIDNSIAPREMPFAFHLLRSAADREAAARSASRNIAPAPMRAAPGIMPLVSNSGATGAQAAHMPLFLDSNNLNANVSPTPNNNDIQVTPINNNTTAALLPPINLNVNTAARYNSSSSHLPFSAPLISAIPTIPSIPTNNSTNIAPENNRKRKRVDTPPVPPVAAEKEANGNIKVDADTEDDNCCSICLEPWNRSGSHQLCCLPCGHLFGRSCIDQWLKKKRTCPNCKYSMKGKKATLIFGAPHRLVTVDQGEIEDVKNKLEKEKETHEKTKKRLKDSRDEIRLLNRRVRHLTSLQVLGGGNSGHGGSVIAGREQPHSTIQIQRQAQEQSRYARIAHIHRDHASQAERRNAMMNAVRSVHERHIIEDSPAPGNEFPPLGPMTVRTNPNRMGHGNGNSNRPRSLLDVAARLPNITGPLREHIRITAGVGGGNGGNNVSSVSRMEVTLMFEVMTEGGSKALAFDDSGNVIFNERKPLMMGNANANGNSAMSIQKICRRPIVGPSASGMSGLTSRSRVEIMGRINDICNNGNPGSAYRGYISVCVQSKKVLILNRALDEVVSYTTPSIPLCSWWVGTGEAENPNGSSHRNSDTLLVGLIDGHIMAFDMRNTTLGPMALRKINGNGPIAVHSIAQVGSTILAATPTRILKVSFSELANQLVLQQIFTVPPGELCSSLAIHRKYILVSTRQNNEYGKHTIYNGLSDDSNGLGEIVQADLTGHKMVGLYEKAAILADNNKALVLAPDVGEISRFTRCWQRHDGNGNSNWGSEQIGMYQFSPGTGIGLGQTAVVKTLALPHNANQSQTPYSARMRIGNAPMVGMAAHLGDNRLQIFSIVRR